MIREAEWQKEGRKVQHDERLLPGRGGERQRGKRREGRRGKRRGGRREKVARTSAWNINLHSSYVQSQVLSFSHFFPCPVYLSLRSLCVSLPVLAACLCFTLSNHSGVLRSLSLSLHIFVFSCCFFPLRLCLLLSLLMAVCLHVFLGWLGVCLSILSSQAAGSIPCVH